jgi:hypothetical protein
VSFTFPLDKWNWKAAGMSLHKTLIFLIPVKLKSFQQNPPFQKLYMLNSLQIRLKFLYSKLGKTLNLLLGVIYIFTWQMKLKSERREPTQDSHFLDTSQIKKFSTKTLFWKIVYVNSLQIRFKFLYSKLGKTLNLF